MAVRTPRTGLLAEFGSAEEMLTALSRLRETGFAELDTLSPCPVDEVEEILGLERSRLGTWAVVAGAVGAVLAFVIQWYTRWDYPLNVGGRPLLSIPTWIPLTVVTGVLFAAITTVVVLAVYTRLPALWHPIFEVEGIERASIDRYWVAVGAGDPCFHPLGTVEELEGLGALRIVRIREGA